MDALIFYKLARGYKHINAFALKVQSAHLNPKIPFSTAKENKYTEIAAARYNEEIAGINGNAPETSHGQPL